jgi:CheY-like chemotaxis protein
MISPGNILIVDDEPHVRRYLSLVVRSLGPVQVHEAPDGEAALALYPSIVPPPMLVLLDVNMPGIDGIETLRRLRAAGYDNPAAMLTSLANRQTIEDAISAGADNYIRKDTPREEITAALRDLLAPEEDEGDETSDPSA